MTAKRPTANPRKRPNCRALHRFPGRFTRVTWGSGIAPQGYEQKMGTGLILRCHRPAPSIPNAVPNRRAKPTTIAISRIEGRRMEDPLEGRKTEASITTVTCRWRVSVLSLSLIVVLRLTL